MKRGISMLVLVVLLLAVTAYGESFLPLLTDIYGVPMPSLGAVLHRYPSSEMNNAEDGMVQEWTNVTENDFEKFGTYLNRTGVALENYSVDNGVLTATIVKDGRTFYFVYDSDKEKAIVTYPKGTYDERGFEAEAHYNKAKECLENRDYLGAYIEFCSIEDYLQYKDVANIFTQEKKLASAPADATEEKRKPYKKIGNTVTFGTYPQTASGTDDTPIEWIVLDVKGNKALLISRFGLDAMPYNTSDTGITWENCTLRSWMNNEFYNRAFTNKERGAILTTSVENGSSQGFDWYWYSLRAERNPYGGGDTKDKVFLLSYAEAKKYFNVTYENNKNVEARVAPTAYTKAKRPWSNHEPSKTSDDYISRHWLLRSPGDEQSAVTIVCDTGSIFRVSVDTDSACIRPVIWLDLNADFFTWEKPQ